MTCPRPVASKIPVLLVALIALHATYLLTRFPRGSLSKRADDIKNEASIAPLWHFRHADEPTQRLVKWLLENVPADAAVLLQGDQPGPTEALSAALFPALLVDVNSLQRDGTAAGRKVFRGQPPWLATAPGEFGVVVAQPGKLEWARQ